MVLISTFATETTASRKFVLQRTEFSYHMSRMGHAKMIRRQLPLRACWATTVHKCQGTTLNAVGLDLRLPPFTHGLLYVALGRAQTGKSIIALSLPKHVKDTNVGRRIFTNNIVWKELLPNGWRRAASPVDHDNFKKQSYTSSDDSDSDCDMYDNSCL